MRFPSMEWLSLSPKQQICSPAIISSNISAILPYSEIPTTASTSGNSSANCSR